MSAPPFCRTSPRLPRRVGPTVLAPAQTRRNRLSATHPGRLFRMRPGSSMASKLGERNRQTPMSNNNTPQPDPPTTTRSTVSTPPKGRVDGCPSSCRRVVPSGPCGASSNDDQWSRAVVFLLLWVGVLVCRPRTGLRLTSRDRFCFFFATSGRVAG